MFLPLGSGIIELTRSPTPMKGSAPENTFVSMAKWMGMQYSYVLFKVVPPNRFVTFSQSAVVAAAMDMAKDIRSRHS